MTIERQKENLYEITMKCFKGISSFHLNLNKEPFYKTAQSY